MNIQELKKIGTQKLIENSVEEAAIKANILLKFVLSMSKTELLMNDQKPVSKNEEKRYLAYITEIVAGKPIQYITNRQEFMGLNFYVNENVLIPQPDTEILVEKAVARIEQYEGDRQLLGQQECDYVGEYEQNLLGRQNIESQNEFFEKKSKNEQTKTNCKYVRVLDLCTGSGAVAIAIANYFRKKGTNCKIQICASDVSDGALNVAKMNASQLLNFNSEENRWSCKNELAVTEAEKLDDRKKQLSQEEIKNAKKHTNEMVSERIEVQFVKSNMFENIDGKFNLIVSNPPYIETDTISQLSKEVQREPHIALDGGADGLDFYRIIAKEGRNYLKEHGSILVEIGYAQKEIVSRLFEGYAGYDKVECFKDLAGNDRVIVAEFEN